MRESLKAKQAQKKKVNQNKKWRSALVVGKNRLIFSFYYFASKVALTCLWLFSSRQDVGCKFFDSRKPLWIRLANVQPVDTNLDWGVGIFEVVLIPRILCCASRVGF